ncbi:ABC transporter permease [bacterium]|nr:ABC transporter permease [bacterium]
MRFFEVFANEQYRELLGQLTARELAQRYKQSVIGYFWVILNPFIQMLVMSFVFVNIFGNKNLGVAYPLFLFTGLLPWNLFSQSLTSCAEALVGSASLLSKIYFPREILVLSRMLARVVDFLFASIILIGMMIFYRHGVTVHVLWVVPIFVIQFLFTYGLSLFLAAANLFYRDVRHLLNLVVMTWMYLTPVMYDADIFPSKYRWIFQINPMAVFVNAYRQVILGVDPPNFRSLAIGLVLSLVVCAWGYRFFKKLEGQFADSV